MTEISTNSHIDGNSGTKTSAKNLLHAADRLSHVRAVAVFLERALSRTDEEGNSLREREIFGFSIVMDNLIDQLTAVMTLIEAELEERRHD